MLYTGLMRLLGIDYGSKKIGLALSDSTGRFASPLEVIPSSLTTAETIAKICQQEEVTKIVIGHSLNYANEPNLIVADSEKLAEKLRVLTGLEVIFEPEVLTTREAERTVGKDELLDARAAALILKSYIDRHHHDWKIKYL